jgi:hypothetical protein
MNPTQEQIEQAERNHAASLEMLALDTRNYTRQDHIDHARELLLNLDRGTALTMEIVGDQAGDLEANYFALVMRESIKSHLAIAALMPE